MLCPSCGKENPEEARFCLACGTALVEAVAPRVEARKTVTLVFSDVTGSTALGEAFDPETTRHAMPHYFDAMRSVIERHGGTVEKFVGDAVMAVFGIPELHEDDAVRAVRAAAEMRDRLAELNSEVSGGLQVVLAKRPAYAAVKQVIARTQGGCRGQSVQWHHTESVLGVDFGKLRVQSLKQTWWGFSATAKEDATYSAGIFAVQGAGRSPRTAARRSSSHCRARAASSRRWPSTT